MQPFNPSLQPSSLYLQQPSSYVEQSSPNLQQTSISLPPKSPPLQPTSSSPPSPGKITSKKRKMTDDYQFNKALEYLTATASLSSTTDELQDFGNFVAKKLRKYSSRTQCLIQNAIMGIFVNADNGLYEQVHHSYGFPIHPSQSNNHPFTTTPQQL